MHTGYVHRKRNDAYPIIAADKVEVLHQTPRQILGEVAFKKEPSSRAIRQSDLNKHVRMSSDHLADRAGH